MVLAIDTSTQHGSVALAHKGIVLGIEASRGESHSVWLLRACDRVLRAAGVKKSDIEGYAVAIGPGSFTGLRIGIATAKGLAAASGRRCAGVVSLEAMAASVLEKQPHQLLVPVIDARKGEVYYAVYRSYGESLEVVHPPAAGWPENVAELARGGILTGTGAELCRPFIGSETEIISLSAVAPEIARLGARILTAGQGIGPEALEPLYLRKSEAELKSQSK